MINSDYARTARAKGVPEWRVITRHVMRNALIPLVTVIALNIGAVPLSCGSALVQAEGDADDCVDVLLP